MTQQLIPYEQPAGIDLMRLGDVLSKSQYFQDAKDAAQAIVKVLAGQELGIGPIAAMTGLGHLLVRALGVGLGLTPSWFDEHLTAEPTILLRVFRYPAVGDE